MSVLTVVSVYNEDCVPVSKGPISYSSPRSRSIRGLFRTRNGGRLTPGPKRRVVVVDDDR